MSVLKNKKSRLLCTNIVALLFSTSSYAIENMSFKGELIEPPACIISDNNDIVVSFDNIGVNKIDGVNYLRDINYSIECDDNNSSKEVFLIISGEATNYDDSALQTNVDDLGIHLLQNGMPFKLNVPIQINADNEPKIQAVPVKRPGSELSKQSFQATATLQANYQ
ncbi:fimbrial protein [Klebsiella aerogenes]|uniref:fimbrial protein n=1 Tax=Klebsiella aerogenes TaxID=548 RepID=UPI00063BF8D8|nr:fimbrial protein [Klebsiella aerogenes]KLF43443.1 hypothetical protein YA33_12825 [Klebsiella aerogenes]